MKRSALVRKTPLVRVAFKAEPKTEGKPKPPKSRKCAVKTCRKPFVPDAPFVTWCGADCGEVIAQSKLAKIKAAQSAAAKRAKKVERAQDNAKAESLKTLPQLLAEAQREFNRFVRLRDHGKPCICCGVMAKAEFLTGSNIHAGHYRSVGSAPHLRFNEDNVNLQNAKCNLYGSGRAVDYRIGLIARIGLERVEALECNNEVHKWTKDEVRGIRDLYRAKANQIAKEWLS
jgi:hypothetical protein